MGIFERETVRRKPVGTVRLMAAIGLIAFATNGCVRIFSKLPPGLNSAISIAVLVFGIGFVWKLISHNGESFTYKIIDDLLVVERQLGRSSTSYFSLKLEEVSEIRSYDHKVDRRIPGNRRFKVSRQKGSWHVISFGRRRKEKLLFEPSEKFLEILRAHIEQEKVKA
ncbi:hypothetical protein [Acidaminobacter hydrogenoformans]|uniref:Uncharacterized protein n=1 Tax=Acidaminobacter hydrogenoformans DSM 2784 TaxID=1120920 RepID=A0A1G5RZE8_9FIRM|nr:hypothetical protein [Acidaminobacter hydrogenoformans]SCZ79228.1 hypothetical protein SAMN03080599_01657 [Acidaminobacter hydrogenoformans DSM 2784]